MKKQTTFIRLTITTLIMINTSNYVQVHAQAPNWKWAVAGVGSYSAGQTIDSDTSGNIYNAGGFEQTMTFGSVTLNSVGGLDGYISKLDTGGNVLWAVAISGDGAEIIYDITVDQPHNCFYVAGQTNSGVSLICYSTSSLPYSVPGLSFVNAAPFIAKYDLNGNLIWFKLGHTPVLCTNASARVKVDSHGNPILCGNFNNLSSNQNTITFGNVTLTNNVTTGDMEIFLYKLDSTGNVIWGRQSVGGVFGSGQGEFMDMAVDASDNIYLTTLLYFADSVNFGNGVVIHHPYIGTQPSILVKYDSSGTALWGHAYGNTGNSGHIYIQSLETSRIGGKIYLHIGGQAYGSYTLSGTSLNDNLFLCKMDDSGNPIWVTAPTSSVVSGIVEMFRICIDSCGSAYFSGYCGWPDLQIDTLNTSLNGTMYVAKVDSAGGALWIQTVTNAPSVSCKSNDIEIDNHGEIILTGDHYGNPPLYFGGDSIYTSGSSLSITFIAKLASTEQNCTNLTSIMASFNCSDTDICAEGNNCINFSDHSTGNPTGWHWIFTGATPDSSSMQNPTHICYSTPGTYTVTLIVTNAMGSDTLTVSPMIAVGGTPSPPTVTVVGDTLFSSNGAGYQWYFNGNPISSATDSFYIALQGGTYSVEITDGFGCSSLSGGVTVGINELQRQNSAFQIYPSPAFDELFIRSSSILNSTIALYNVLGEKMQEDKLSNTGLTTLNISKLPAGVYFLIFSNGETRVAGNFIKK